MQVGDQVFDLLRLQGHIERRHHIASHEDGFRHALVGGRAAAAGQIFLVKMYQAGPLQRLFFVGIVTNRAVCLKNLLPAPLLSGKLRACPLGARAASGGRQYRKNQESGDGQNKK